MKKIINATYIPHLLLLLIILPSCKKEWLDAKPDKSLVLPTTIKDYQALLDNTSEIPFNHYQTGGMGEMGAGDFYILYNNWKSLFGELQRSTYIWDKTETFYKGEPNAEWATSYKRILTTNIVLEGIAKVKHTASEQAAWNLVKGSALFFRAFDFYCLSQGYCKPYAAATATTDLGIPLRLEYDINVKSVRSTLQQTYDQVISDLKESLTLLNKTPLFKTRPSKQAAYGMLARTYLAMEQYDQAGLYADSVLQIQSDLITYSTLNTGQSNPLKRFNPEVVFHSTFSYGIFGVANLIVEPTLFASYDANDMRRAAFFLLRNGVMTFKGSYNGDKNLFGGIATDEMFLIRAESFARQGNHIAAQKDLNDLMRTRWSGTYTDRQYNNAEEALIDILTERRKELVFRSLRWTDLRRLNKDDRFKVTLTRELNGTTYTLPPNDPRYVLPIDEIEIRFSGIQQNDR